MNDVEGMLDAHEEAQRDWNSRVHLCKWSLSMVLDVHEFNEGESHRQVESRNDAEQEAQRDDDALYDEVSWEREEKVVPTKEISETRSHFGGNVSLT